ncbi:Integrase [Nitratireductor pacificus pht-3B]|uniref:Integrase n=1 Tax=Nitratireductor pacificus pht-3B TaxID=391937 RepID=K2LHG3_9HYPH|nr:Integrase [Nitratireductor pacificus pht-3B]
MALPGPLFSEGFWIAYHKVQEGLPVATPQIGSGKNKAGTIGALIADYYASPMFTALNPSTQQTYRNQLERFRLKHGDKRVAMIQPKHIDMILGEEAAKSPPLASNLRKRLGTLMQCAVKWDYRPDNPMLIASKVKYKTPGIRTWTDNDIKKYRAYWAEGTPERSAFEILLYTGLRRSDAVRLGRQHIQDGHIVISTKKSGEVVQLHIPIHEDFAAFLDTLPKDRLQLIATKRGTARSNDAFGNFIIDAARRAALPAKSSAHGIRKAACRMLAEAGCTALEIMSITGHRDIKEIERYCRAANQKKLAVEGINKLKGKK